MRLALKVKSGQGLTLPITHMLNCIVAYYVAYEEGVRLSSKIRFRGAKSLLEQ